MRLLALVNRLAPEHLQLMLRDAEAVFARIRHAGAVFIGAFCPEAVGDYVAGPEPRAARPDGRRGSPRDFRCLIS